MALEIWILLILAGAMLIGAAVARLRGKRRAAVQHPDRNVYPLW